MPVATSGRRAKVAGSDEEAIDDFTTVGKGGKVMQFTSEGIFKNLQGVQEARGKKVWFGHRHWNHNSPVSSTHRTQIELNKFVSLRNF